MGLRRFFSRWRGKELEGERRLYQILSREYGHQMSAKMRASVDAAGAPIPWYSYPAIEYLNSISLEGLQVLEYGSGSPG